MKGEHLLKANHKSQSYVMPAVSKQRPSFSQVDSSISTMSMPLYAESEGGRQNSSANAALFGALKFKGLLNMRLRARRARLGHSGHHGENCSPSSRSRRASLAEAGDQENGVSSYGTINGPISRQLGDSYVTQPSVTPCEHPEKNIRTDIVAIQDYVFGNKVCVFLVCFPFGLLAKFLGWGDSAIFLFNFFTILPLAQLLGDFTEEVSLYTNDTIGGLLNATLGNATELIISVFAIQRGLLRVVQVSLLGSVLSNELLVTGCCFLFGGWYYKEQHFNSHIASIDSSLLLMAVLGLSIPAAFKATASNDCAIPCRVDSIVAISHITAVLLFFLYGMLLVFQLKTHTHIMDVTGNDIHHQHGSSNSNNPQNLIQIQKSKDTLMSKQSVVSELEDEQDPEEATMTLNAAILMLSIVTVLVAICSEMLVDSIEEVSRSWGLSEVFIGLILLPIIGNAAEHATAITVAMKGKMDLALGVALGSSIQIALCVVPALCMVGWVVDKPLTLDFHPFETIVLVVSVLVVTSAVRQGTSTWLEGIMLIISYCIIAIAYLYRKEPPASIVLTPPDCVCGEACCYT
mmetsp:Transcript_164/g.246  ORF Transcript_164/g.246 Transcript_164/m.246 type:complete len:574 (-) Transcript_164:35-1756(-)